MNRLDPDRTGGGADAPRVTERSGPAESVRGARTRPSRAFSVHG